MTTTKYVRPRVWGAELARTSSRIGSHELNRAMIGSTKGKTGGRVGRSNQGLRARRSRFALVRHVEVLCHRHILYFQNVIFQGVCVMAGRTFAKLYKILQYCAIELFHSRLQSRSRDLSNERINRGRKVVGESSRMRHRFSLRERLRIAVLFKSRLSCVRSPTPPRRPLCESPNSCDIIRGASCRAPVMRS